MSSVFLIEKKVEGSDCAIVLGTPPPRFWEEAGAAYSRALWICADETGDASRFAGKKPRVERLPLPAPPGVTPRSRVEKFLEESLRYLPCLLVCRGVETNPLYEPVLRAVFEVLEAAFRIQSTRQRDSLVWQVNCLRNVLDYADHRLPEDSRDLLRGRPAWVVGAAPSLDRSIHALKQVRPFGVLFAADSAWRALRAHGLEPDFVVSMDASKTAERCVPEGDVRGTRVVLCLTSPADWTGRVPPNQRYYLSCNQLTHAWLEKTGVANTAVSATVNCGVTALSLARFLGCSPIFLFGMDFALDPANPTGRHHAGWRDDANPMPATALPRVPGNFCADVPTHAFGEWREVNRLLASYPAGLVHAVTDRGARLENTRVIRTEDFPAKETLRRKPPEPWSFPPSHAPAASTRESLEASLRKLSARLHTFVPRVKKLLSDQGPDAAADALSALIRDGENGLMLGAFVLKWAPRLLPPAMREPGDWRELLQELEQLGTQMGDLRSIHAAV